MVAAKADGAVSPALMRRRVSSAHRSRGRPSEMCRKGHTGSASRSIPPRRGRRPFQPCRKAILGLPSPLLN